MNIQSYSKIVKLLGIILVLMLPLYFVVYRLIGVENKIQNITGYYVGAETCKECHKPEYEKWLESHHYKSMALANDSTVLGDFSDVEIYANNTHHRFYRLDKKFMVETDGETGVIESFEVRYVFGFSPIQQYLVEFKGGRLQTLALTWNSVDGVWYHMADSIYKNQNIDYENWLHWTNQAQNWNSMCADCHTTGFKKNYNLESDSYKSTWEEINVSCEPCHGGGVAHIQWAKLPDYARDDIANAGLPVKTSNIDNVDYVSLCAQCHSRRSSLSDNNPSVKSIYDNIIPELPAEPNWFIDGQIKEEDYVHASFLQSRMYKNGVKCNDCHDVHSGKRYFDDNRLCLQCHKKDVYDTEDHHFHKQVGGIGRAVVSVDGIKYGVGEGAKCVNCHMFGRYFMGVDFRNDHSFRIPQPYLSIELGTPNACNQCHANKSYKWALEYVEKWYGKRKRYHYGLALSGKPNVNKLKDVFNDPLYPTNIRALALERLGQEQNDSIIELIDKHLNDLDPIIRLSAVRSFRIKSSDDIVKISRLLTDEVKAVRNESVRILMALGKESIPVKYLLQYSKAETEYKDVLVYNSDFPIGKYNLGNYYYSKGDYNEAESFFLKALGQDKELQFINLNLAHLYNKKGINKESAYRFEKYLEVNPGDAQVLYSYGLLLSEMKEYKKSLCILLKSAEKDLNQPRLYHNIAMLYNYFNDRSNCERYLIKEMAIAGSFESGMELINFYISKEDWKKADELYKKLHKKYPDKEELKHIVNLIKTTNR
ncbi:MAG: hypothetical protein JW717_06245 [Marinilabiliaceae bacterium]|nr:hypothetical protein [Marinilabiliaceae bacterium]